MLEKIGIFFQGQGVDGDIGGMLGGYPVQRTAEALKNHPGEALRSGPC